jgi:hypothetical protein
MPIKIIPLNRLEADLRATLNECADSVQITVAELPDRRPVAIQPLDPEGDDTLMDELEEANPRFQELVARNRPRPRSRDRSAPARPEKQVRT